MLFTTTLPPMNITPLQKITYGLYVVGTSDKGRPTGCIINTCFQVTSENPIVAISMNKNNYTHDAIVSHRRFSLAILAEESDTSLITTFGFQSGRDRNKYDGRDYTWQHDVPILKGKFSGHIVCELLHVADNETHDVFFARVIDTLPDDGTPMTYTYYHQVIKGRAPKNAPTYVEEEKAPATEAPQTTTSTKRYVCEVCGYKKGDGYPTMMVFGIVYAAQVGMAIIPFKQAALTVMSAYETMSGTHIDYAKYMFIALVACALCSLLFLLIGKYIFRPDVSKLADLDTSKLDKDQSLTLSKVQKMVLGFLFALVALLLIPAFLPKDLAVVKFLKSIGNTGICMFLVGVMCFIKVNGKPLLRFKAMVDDGVAWGIIFILAMVQPLSGAMANPASGITPFLMTMLEPLFGSGSPLFFALCMGLLATILTQFINNGAVGVALMPVIFSYCTNLGVGPELPVIMVVMGVHLAFLTPAASSSAALLHGNEWASTRSIWKSSPIVILLSWILMSAVIAVMGSILF